MQQLYVSLENQNKEKLFAMNSQVKRLDNRLPTQEPFF